MRKGEGRVKRVAMPIFPFLEICGIQNVTPSVQVSEAGHVRAQWPGEGRGEKKKKRGGEETRDRRKSQNGEKEKKRKEKVKTVNRQKGEKRGEQEIKKEQR